MFVSCPFQRLLFQGDDPENVCCSQAGPVQELDRRLPKGGEIQWGREAWGWRPGRGDSAGRSVVTRPGRGGAAHCCRLWMDESLRGDFS